MEKIAFLDRDGTINVEKNYLFQIKDFQFIKGAQDAIKLLNDNGYKVVIVTNQAGIGRGYYSEEDVNKLHDHINEELHHKGAHIDHFLLCPHHPTDGIGEYKKECECRKPKTGMLQKVEEWYTIDKRESWLIGDNYNDILAGTNFNINTILVSTGYGKRIYSEMKEKLSYNYYAEDLLDAVKYILNIK